jgi:hypothetical protein
VNVQQQTAEENKNDKRRRRGVELAGFVVKTTG